MKNNFKSNAILILCALVACFFLGIMMAGSGLVYLPE